MTSNPSAQNLHSNDDETGKAQSSDADALASESADFHAASTNGPPASANGSSGFQPASDLYDPRPAAPWDSAESTGESTSSSTPQLNSLLQKLSDVYGAECGTVSSVDDPPFIDPALESLDYLGIDFDVLARGALHGGWERAFGIEGGVAPALREYFDLSLRGNHSTKEDRVSASAFPKDQYSYGMPNRDAQLHEWFAVPVGKVTLFYDSEILSFRDSGVAVSLAIGMQNFLPSAGLLTASCGAVSLWQDLKVFGSGRSGIEKTKYALGALADTAIIAGGVGAAMKNVSPETRVGLVSCGYVGRLLVELIPNLVKHEKSDSQESSH